MDLIRPFIRPFLLANFGPPAMLLVPSYVGESVARLCRRALMTSVNTLTKRTPSQTINVEALTIHALAVIDDTLTKFTKFLNYLPWGHRRSVRDASALHQWTRLKWVTRQEIKPEFDRPHTYLYIVTLVVLYQVGVNFIYRQWKSWYQHLREKRSNTTKLLLDFDESLRHDAQAQVPTL